LGAVFEDYVANTLFKNSVTGHYVQHSVCPVVQITRYHTVFRTPKNNPNLVFKINDIFLTQVLKIRVSAVQIRLRAPLISLKLLY